MSSGLQPDRQFDFGGGIDERATRFKQPTNGLFSGVDIWAGAEGIEPLDRYSTVSGGTITGGYAMVIPEPYQARVRVFWSDDDGNSYHRPFNENGATAAAGLTHAAGKQLIRGWANDGGTIYALTWDDSGLVEFVTAAAGANAVVVAAAPTGHNLALLHRGYAFLMGMATRNVRYSVQNDYTTWPSASDFDAPIEGGILSAASMRGVLFGFSSHETFMLNGRGPGTATGGGLSDFSASTVTTKYGIPWHETIQEIGGRIWALSDKGVVIFDGGAFQEIGRELDLYDQIPEVSTTTRINWMCGSYYDQDRGLYFLSMPKLVSGTGTTTQTPKVYIFNTKTGKVLTSAELAAQSNNNAIQAFSMCRSVFSDGKAFSWAMKQRLSSNTANLQTFSVCANRTVSSSGPSVSGTTVKSRFFFWGAPELPKFPSHIELFGSNGSSFNSATVVSENQSVNIGSVSIGTTGVKTIPFPSTMNAGSRFYGLDLTSGQKDYRLEGVAIWAHVGERPRR